MEEQSKNKVEQKEEAAKVPELFQIVNTVRSRFNRVQRYQAPQHARLKQHLGGGDHRIIRGRPLIISEQQLMVHLEELKEKVAQGLLEVRTVDGRVVDLSTMSPAPAPVPVPQPKKVLDSAKNDTNLNIGEQLPQFPGGVPVTALAADGTTSVGGIPGPLEAEPPAGAQAPAAEASIQEFLDSDGSGKEDESDEEEEAPFVDPAVSASTQQKGKKGKR